MITLARVILACALVATAAWVIAWRRARPDLCERWLAIKLTGLLGAIAFAACCTALAHPMLATVGVWVAATAGTAVAVRLWTTRRWMTRPLDPALAIREARRLVAAADAEAENALREAERRG